MLSNFFKLEKLTIVGHTKAERTDISIPENTFEAMFNPETYSLTYQNVYDPKQGINTSGRKAKYALTKPEKLSIKLILDGSGVSTSNSINLIGKGYKDVYKRVQDFLEITGKMDGEIHEPKYLTLKWGDLLFKCRLASVQVNYSLFNRHGIPIRAELNTEFFGDLETSERLKEENKSSPDLTHYRIVGAHDRLPMMCEKIYGSAQYYTLVAKANNLDDFRNLKPGQEIYFPPIAQ
ncbi:hypothetical protein [uncultured Aquimarina sp.]|uniref:CIS tube protein n=1 Tax=uncultured Aquimarina sp. TaxID=575652 RepID=UPI002625CBD1|nr:hypothetical protein [uncultured Aquimarina sp.]